MDPLVSFELKLLGPFEARIDEQPIGHLRSKKSRWLLALLALRAGREVERSWLAGTLWPNSSDAQALSALRTTLKDVRRALGGEAWRLQGGAGSTLRLDLTDAKVDVASFDDLIKGGNLVGALEFYRGELLEGCYEDWIMGDRSARADQAVLACETIAESALASGDYDGAETCARRVLTMEPLRESALRMLMLALSSAGNHAGVEKEFARFQKLLARELNSEPDPETSAHYHKLRSRRSRASMPGRPRVASAPQAYVLPKPLTTLIGREEELQEVETRVRLNRLVTLIGTGGIGKTRMAVAAAEGLAASFKWGACFVELAGIADDARVPDAVLQALGIRPRPGTDSLKSIRHVLAASDLLLVLDNCEHVVEGSARTVAEMLGANDSLRVLATSREPLGITGEIRWKLPPLTVPEESESEEASCRAASVALFLERAEQASGTFEPDPEDLSQAFRICRMLDGIPLALEMAAAHTPTMSLSEVADHLNDRFAFLRDGSRAAPERQRTLEATLDWSYRLLSDEERLLLQRLSVFSGGGSNESAVKVCGGDGLDPARIPAVLEALMRKSLVEREAGGERDRFRLLESVREYALRALTESQQRSHIQEAHARFFAGLAIVTFDPAFGVQAVRTRRFRIDQGNFRAAISWTLDEAGRMAESDDLETAAELATMALDITGACAQFGGWLGNTDDALQNLLDALGIADHMLTRHAEATVSENNEKLNQLRRARIVPLRLVGEYAEHRGDTSEALDYLQRAIESAIEHGVAREEAACLCVVGFVYHDLGQCDLMRDALGRAHEIATSLRDLSLQSTCHLRSGQLAWLERDFERSERHYRLCRRLAREAGNEARISSSAIFLAQHCVRDGRIGEGIQLAREGVDENYRCGFMVTFPLGLEVLAQAMEEAGEPRHAALLLGAADGFRSTITRTRNVNQDEYRTLVATLGRKLGKAEFTALYEEGTGLTCEEALALALQDPHAVKDVPIESGRFATSQPGP